MGNASLRQTTGNQYITQDLRNYFQNDLPKFVLQAKIGNGKFMKTYIMRVDSVPLIVKVYMKLNEEDLLIPTANLTVIWKTLSPAKYPNLLPYQMWLKSSSRIKSAASPVYLIRQFFHANLYDRLSTRPFLNELEKWWILFQLFKCLEICHEHGIIHGDIKPENVMCTTSNWVVLTDFSPFKPAFIPNDDPTDFQYYFDCMGRHRCYLAPERFYERSAGTTPSQQIPDLRFQYAFSKQGQGQQGQGQQGSTPLGRFQRAGSAVASVVRRDTAATPSNSLTQAMDVFALGCLMAEVTHTHIHQCVYNHLNTLSHYAVALASPNTPHTL
jgi:serine/threonine protein kinase